jgi:hypothetical protein
MYTTRPKNSSETFSRREGGCAGGGRRGGYRPIEIDIDPRSPRFFNTNAMSPIPTIKPAAAAYIIETSNTAGAGNPAPLLA